MLQILIGLLAMCLIIIVELFQSNKRLKRCLSKTKQKWRDCSMRTSRSKTKLMSQGIMNWSVIDDE